MRRVKPASRIFDERLTAGDRSLKDAEQRIQWLEKIVDGELGVDCHRLPTGTPIISHVHGEAPLQPTAAQSTPPTTAQVDACDAGSIEPGQSGLDESPHAEASNMSILALNATGEQRYLGPSSGSFFASYAASILRSRASGHEHVYSEQACIRDATEISRSAIEGQLPLQPSTVKLLQKSYEMWINPLYPLMSLHRMNNLVARCAKSQTPQPMGTPGTTEDTSEMTIFFLIMALGAMNRARTLSQPSLDDLAEFSSPTAAPPSPAMLYSLAMQSFQMLSVNLQPSVSVITILLLVCIYSSQSPLGPSQWQLAGFAMRVGYHTSRFMHQGVIANAKQSAVEIGLHHSMTDCRVSEDEGESRNRVFWTAYVIEVTISYNLGRPPSIGDEHITADYPTHSAETALAIHHVKHRRIQGRIISKVYCGALAAGQKNVEEQQELITKLQNELDDWNVGTNALCSPSDECPYPQRCL